MSVELQPGKAAAIRYEIDKQRSISKRIFRVYGAIHIQLEWAHNIIEWAFNADEKYILRYDNPKDIDEPNYITNTYAWDGELISIDMTNF